MRPRDPCILFGLLLAVLLLAAVGWVAGCSRSQPQFKRPPAAAVPTKKPVRRNQSAHLVVIGQFRTPVHPLRWGDVGPGMSGAVARTLLNRGDFDVWLNPLLVRRVEALAGLEPVRRAKELASIQHDFPDVRFVVSGKVTDFHHTTDTMLGNSNEKKAVAVVAIRLDIFDLKLGRMAASDHVIGTASAPNIPSNELYAGVTFDAYLFWSTPLGEASHAAVGEAVAVFARVAEKGNRTIRVTERLGGRRVRIVGGLPAQFEGDKRFYVYQAVPGSEMLEPVRDRDTRLPLQARVEEPDDDGRTAWLLGRTAPEVELRGAVLRLAAPRETAASETPKPAAVTVAED